MGGSGIRYFELAKELAKHFEVTLAIPNEPELSGLPFKTIRYINEASFPPLIDSCDYIVAQLIEGPNVKYAVKQKKVIIYDFYNSIPIEYLGSLAFSKHKPTAQNDEMFKKLLSDYELFSLSGDYFICSNERQRDFWIGMLTATGNLLPTTVGGRTTEDLIGIVPFGLPAEAPKHRKSVMRGTISGIDNNDFILLWAGGIWDWFDPLSAIRAMALLADHPQIKLVFMGGTHPNKEIGRMSMADQAVKLAQDLGLYNKSIFFVSKWVDYAERANYLLEANLGISTHFNSLETRFSFRTRILDHLWTGLPSLITRGDWFSQYLAEQHIGVEVEYQNPESIARAIVNLYDKPETLAKMRAKTRTVAPDFLWEVTTKDLVSAISRIETPLPKDASLVPALDFNSTFIENHQLQDEISGIKRELRSSEADRVRLGQELHSVYNSRKWRMAMTFTSLYNVLRGRKR